MEKEKEEKESKGKRPGSRQSSKSRLSKDEGVLSQEQAQTDEEPQEEEPYWPVSACQLCPRARWTLDYVGSQLFSSLPRMESDNF